MREERIYFGAGRATFIFPPEIECFASIISQEEARLSVAWKIYEPIFLVTSVCDVNKAQTG